MQNFDLLKFNISGDERGNLIAIENLTNIPFEIKRIYYIFNTRENIRRGFHAHKNLKQVAICIAGNCKFLLDDGTKKTIISLNNPNQGLLLQGLLWREMFDFSEDCILLVLASHLYDESDYIRDYNDFLQYIQNLK